MLELNGVFHCGLVLGMYGTFIGDPCEPPCSTGLALCSSKTRTFLSRDVSCFDSPGTMPWHTALRQKVLDLLCPGLGTTRPSSFLTPVFICPVLSVPSNSSL